MSLDAARLVLQLALGVVFLVSTAGKLRSPAAFLRGVAEYEILPRPLALALGVALIPAEAFLAVAYLTGWAVAVAPPLTVVLLLVFAAAVAITLRRRRDVLCHCYGSFGSERVSLRSLAQLGLLLAAALAVWSGPGGGAGPGRVLHGPGEITLALAWALGGILVALWVLRADELVALARGDRCSSCSKPADTTESAT
ncbi:MAG: hypothetical protein AUI14_24955 [Actinobacteria bacterium 13_2_20CM_2_71_6]|nr:MAG: hypothetical protein AUI14_24955 [Actinobacteria bacterium 13_2_20CM_2_71_6]